MIALLIAAKEENVLASPSSTSPNLASMLNAIFDDRQAASSLILFGMPRLKYEHTSKC